MITIVLQTSYAQSSLNDRLQLIQLCGFPSDEDPLVVVGQILGKPESNRTVQENQLTACWWDVYQQARATQLE